MDNSAIPGGQPSSSACFTEDDQVQSRECSSDTVEAGYDENETEFVYDLGQEQKGIFLVFSQENFHPTLNLPKRVGTSVDEIELKKVFGKIGFIVKIFRDLTTIQVLNEIDKYSKADHSKYGCFACAVMSHGSDDGVVFAYESSYFIKNLYEPFRDCKSLVGKPKLFFIQACRGKNFQDGNEKLDCLDDGNDILDTIPFGDGTSIPREADFLIAYSTVEGYYSWKNPVTGSWFIQTLTKCVEKYGHKWNLMKILMRVNRDICIRESKHHNHKMKGKKQCPSIVYQLNAAVYLKQKQNDVTDSKILTKVKPNLVRSSSPGNFMKEEPNDSTAVEYYRMKLEALEMKQKLGAMKQKLYEKKLQQSTPVRK